MPSRHVMTMVSTVDANTGAPVNATAIVEEGSTDRVHFVKEPIPINSVGRFGDGTVTVTLNAEGYEPQSVVLSGGSVVVNMEPLKSAGE